MDSEMGARKKKVVCFPYSGDEVGGSHISSLGLIRSLDANLFELLIVTQVADGNIAALFRNHGIATQAHSNATEFGYDTRITFSKLLGTLRGLPAQIRFLKDRNVDIVHTNDGRTHANWALAARLAGAKLLWHHRGDPSALGLRFVAPLLANRVVAVSQFALPVPGVFSAAHKARVIHSPFDTSITENRTVSHATIVAELACDPDTYFCGYLGAFVARKRPFLFIDTIAEFRRIRPKQPVIGLMFGEANDGSTETELRNYAQAKGLGESIKFMGFRSPGPFWLAGCDVLLIPAVGEPFGRTLIEAMLVGTPVVATASGGNIEALRDGLLGVLVSPENAGALAAGCLRLLDDPDFASAIVDRARSDARGRFGMKAHSDAVTEVYLDMCGQK